MHFSHGYNASGTPSTLQGEGQGVWLLWVCQIVDFETKNFDWTQSLMRNRSRLHHHDRRGHRGYHDLHGNHLSPCPHHAAAQPLLVEDTG